MRPVDRATAADTSEAKHEANHRPLSVEGAGSNSPNLLNNLRQGCSDNLGQVLPPDFSLEIFECTKILRRSKLTDAQVVLDT